MSKHDELKHNINEAMQGVLDEGKKKGPGMSPMRAMALVTGSAGGSEEEVKRAWKYLITQHPEMLGTLPGSFGRKAQELMDSGELDETITKDMSAGEVIHDIVHSDNPMFDKDSKKKRIKRALAAYYRKQNEETEPLDETSKKKARRYFNKANDQELDIVTKHNSPLYGGKGEKVTPEVRRKLKNRRQGMDRAYKKMCETQLDEGPGRTVVIMRGKHYELESSGNGLTYTLKDKVSGKSTFVQGDDADQFKGELDKVENKYPNWSTDRVLAWMWDQLEYGSVAESRSDHEVLKGNINEAMQDVLGEGGATGSWDKTKPYSGTILPVTINSMGKRSGSAPRWIADPIEYTGAVLKGKTDPMSPANTGRNLAMAAVAGTSGMPPFKAQSGFFSPEPGAAISMLARSRESNKEKPAGNVPPLTSKETKKYLKGKLT